MMRNKVKSIGIGLTDRIEGPYELCIHRMWATNGMSAAELEEERKICGNDAMDPKADAADERTVAEKEGEGVEKLKGLGKEWDK